MQTSQTGAYSFKTGHGQLTINGPRQNGFTLIELVVVVFILALTLSIILPSFWRTGENSVKTEARHISGTLRYIYNEAVAKKQTFLVSFNLDEQSWGFIGKHESRNFTIKNNVEIENVLVPSHGEVSEGELIIAFGPMGPEEPIVVHLKKDEIEYTVVFNQLNGRTKIHEGYEF